MTNEEIQRKMDILEEQRIALKNLSYSSVSNSNLILDLISQSNNNLRDSVSSVPVKIKRKSSGV
jgi:hypothetical protein